MADQNGRHSEMVTQLLRHVTSQPHNADVKGDIFRHSTYPPSVVVIAVYSRDYGGGVGGSGICSPPVVEDQKNPGLNRIKVKIRNLLFLNLQNQHSYADTDSLIDEL